MSLTCPSNVRSLHAQIQKLDTTRSALLPQTRLHIVVDYEQHRLIGHYVFFAAKHVGEWVVLDEKMQQV